ncbi:MAG: 16S rRNA (cytidine(1402)-2'-O)-methyltransferase [Gemmatimonadetes bacterium]|nr:16S rRNA (cytidine(1402)-2'-O)-methyltransferase [Gemmatimonadota bacterium]NIR78929.1 16S rRNA (cytidine(1402)-2'-O)-methyltransferase [Gemmatimonadota bacterium]NIT87566.1 16S rRNA (cytidine(1402)-2'-O)-methyltransferase [Gemmatimonadota bacterium]NIU31432.1 16S rRNA (cytidine(1402)-2'-O)-methyltransferase [Gemmatimonadota bacterium]NIU36113.1 16S rRNA (cytidine(1402)-2'-O)-methyltransferase [Gemmatimonadota bacterium]
MGTLHLVSTPIGNLGDVTRRAAGVLGSVDTVLAEDTRRTRILLEHLGLKTRLRSLHAHNEAQRVEEVLEALERGDELALVSDAGTPGVSDPGARLARAAAEAGHRVVPVPGPSAVLAALAASGLPADRFTFLGFPPRKGGERDALLERVASAAETVVLFESPERLVALLGDLEALCGPDRRVAVARELTKVHEEFVRGTIEEARRYYGENPPRGEVTVVVEAAPEAGEPDAVDEEAARALARALLDEGHRPSRAAREVSRRLGVPRNLAYEIVHSLPR